MYLRKPILVLLLSVAFSCGRGVINIPGAFPRHEYVGIEIESHIFDQGIDKSVEQWKTEVHRRFSNAYIVFCHGNDINGQWAMFPEDGFPVLVKTYAQRLRDRMPGRPIVLICCNPQGHNLCIPGVYHARDSVWFFTDKQTDNRERSSEQPGVVGNIFEFDDA